MTQSLAYRADIDGLRALAVLAVVLYHAEFPGLSGGFVGVDVFFVISGFLITRIIHHEVVSGTFSLVSFFAARARRLIPALTLVVCICMVAGAMLLPPRDFMLLLESIPAVVAYGANVYFWRTADYFGPDSGSLALLHTWSLGVEEQFYLLFPLALLAIRRGCPRALKFLMVVGISCSLALAEWGWRNAPSPNFFLLPTRAWELLFGCAIALNVNEISERLSDRAREVLQCVGLLAVVCSIVFFTPSTPSPSLLTLGPVLGAGMLLIGASASTAVSRALSFQPVVAIGLMSYSIYLWHQPVFVFSRVLSPNALDWNDYFIPVCITLVLAYLSWRYVENPIRRAKFARSTVLWGAGFSAALIIGASIWLARAGGNRDLFPSELMAAIDAPHSSVMWEGCVFKPMTAQRPDIEVCEFGDLNASKVVGLWGDSHASMLLNSLNEALRARGIKGLVVRVQGCEVIPGIIPDTPSARADATRCVTGHADLLGELAKSVDHLIVSIRWTYKLYPVDGRIDAQGFNNGVGGVERVKPQAYCALVAGGECLREGAAKHEAMARFIESLGGSRIRSTIIGPVPEAGWELPRRLWADYLLRGTIPQAIAYPRSSYDSRHEFAFEGLRSAVEKSERVDLLDAAAVFCDKSSCVLHRDGVPFYFDDNHINYEGANLLVDAWLSSAGLD